MLLLDLNGRYFWIASREMHGESWPPEIVAKVHDLAWRILDKLREVSDVPYLEEIVTVLTSEDSYRTANDRAKALNAVIDKVGEAVNPQYTKVVKGISDRNVLGFVGRPPQHQNNAPALLSPIPTNRGIQQPRDTPDRM